MKMNPVMAWFTGNIGYHHIHHLNSKIPFYRLPEVMNHFTELQNCKTTSLAPKDIHACFKLKVWDQESNQMIGVKGL
jgi:omega-6 fatty acid desaturase (delta-12 desaturase)